MSIFTKFRSTTPQPEPTLADINTEAFILAAQGRDEADRALALVEKAARQFDLANNLAEDEIDALVDVQHEAQYGFGESTNLIARLRSALEVAD